MTYATMRLFTALLSCLLFFAPLEALAAHTLDTTGACSGAKISTANPGTSRFTTGSGATVFVLGIEFSGTSARTGGAPTYGGYTMTQASSTQTGGENGIEIWYLLNPPIGANAISIPNGGGLNLASSTASFKAAAGSSSALDIANGAINPSTGSTNPGLSTTTATGRTGTTTVTTTVNGDAIFAMVADGANSWVPTWYGGGTKLCDSDIGLLGYSSQYVLQASLGKITAGWAGPTSTWGEVVASFKEVTISKPTVTTDSAGSFTANSANVFGSITNIGNANPTTVGFAISTNSSLSSGVSTSSTSGRFDAGSFTYSTSTLSASQTYYYRAYATNSAGTGYGAIYSFTTGNSTPSRRVRLFEGFKIKIISNKIKALQQ